MAYCDRCDRDFKDEHALEQHRFSSSRHVVCGSCEREFTSVMAREQHYIHSSLHYYCKECQALFSDAGELREHNFDEHSERCCRDCGLVFGAPGDLHEHRWETPRHNYCRECRKLFRVRETFRSHLEQRHRSLYCTTCKVISITPKGIENHYIQAPEIHHFCKHCRVLYRTANALNAHYKRSLDHHYCDKCNLLFDTVEALKDHYEKSDVHHFCRSCGEKYDNEDDFDEHNAQCHWYCADCRRLFISEVNLHAHQDCAIHNTRNFDCPGIACPKAFLNEGDLIAHWETGTCPVTGVDRQRVNDSFVAADTKCAFLNRALLDLDSNGYFKAPRLGSTQIPNSARVGKFWQCPRCTQKFRDRMALQAHLDSAAHEPQIYVCALRYGGCGTSYATLSAFVRHAANAGSERCSFSKAYLDDSLARFRYGLFGNPRRIVHRLPGIVARLGGLYAEGLDSDSD